MIKAPNFDSKKEFPEEKLDSAALKPKEEVSTLAMIATEAIYKFIRRNQKL